jgi:hypothetical protein
MIADEGDDKAASGGGSGTLLGGVVGNEDRQLYMA